MRSRWAFERRQTQFELVEAVSEERDLCLETELAFGTTLNSRRTSRPVDETCCPGTGIAPVSLVGREKCCPGTGIAPDAGDYVTTRMTVPHVEPYHYTHLPT
jgi:hypothetical protein